VVALIYWDKVKPIAFLSADSHVAPSFYSVLKEVGLSGG
jgi:hypothetical protein